MKTLLALTVIPLAIDLAKLSVAAYYTTCSKPSTLKTLGLRSKLFCDYDNTIRPGGANPTKVKLILIPKFFEFDDATCTLAVHSWMSVSWEDPHLDWANDPDYSNIDKIHVSSNEIWTPDITAYNSGEIGHEESEMPTTKCLATIRKTITCLPAIKYVTRCSADYQHWPFDRQSCVLRLGSWLHTVEELDYQLINTGLDMVDYTENLEWKVLSVNISKEMLMFGGFGGMHPSVVVNIILERHSTYRQATVVAPAILLVIVTLTVLWLNPMTSERMILAGLNLACHLLCVMDLDWQVPFNGASLPSILVFHRNSMIMASVALFLTAVLRQLKETSIPAPVWLSSITSVMLENRAGQFILLTTLDPKTSTILENVEEDNAGLVTSNTSTPKINPAVSAWHHLVNLIDRLSFASILFSYVIMIIVLIPKNDIIDS